MARRDSELIYRTRAARPTTPARPAPATLAAPAVTVGGAVWVGGTTVPLVPGQLLQITELVVMTGLVTVQGQSVMVRVVGAVTVQVLVP